MTDTRAPSAIGPLGERIAADLEAFIRARFDVSAADPLFGREVDLFEEGYVDSVGVVEVVNYLESTYGLTVPDASLFDPRFCRIQGMAEILAPLVGTGAAAPDAQSSADVTRASSDQEDVRP